MALDLLKAGKPITVQDSKLRGVDNGDPEVTYTIHQISPAKNQAVIKAHSQQRRGFVEVDNLAVLDDLVDLALQGWSGILLDGVPAPCSRELKLSGLDFTRKQAIVETALSMTAARAEARAESFREPSSVG